MWFAMGMRSMARELQASGAEVLQQIPLSETPAVDSIGYKVWEIENHIHPSEGNQVYPTGSTGVTLSSAGTVDEYGAWVEIMPADTIGVKFDPNQVYIVSVSNFNRTYRIELGVGGPGSEVAFGCTLGGKQDLNKDVKEVILGAGRRAANSRISGRVLDDGAAVNSLVVFVGYHKYVAAGLQ